MSGEGEKRLGCKESEQPEAYSRAKGEIDALPENPAHFWVIAPAGILGNKYSCITADTAEKGYKKIWGNAGRESGGYCI